MESFCDGCARDLRLTDALRLPGLRRIHGTEIFVFTAGRVDGERFLSHVRRARWLASHVLLVQVQTSSAAHVAITKQASAVEIVANLFVLTVRFGVQDRFDLPRALTHCSNPAIDLSLATFVVDAAPVCARSVLHMPTWQRWLSTLVAWSGPSASRHFHLPAGRVFSMQGA